MGGSLVTPFHSPSAAASPLFAHQPRLVALPVLGFLGLALVGLPLALGEADLAFGEAALVEVDRQRHNGHAVTADGAEQLVELAVMEQQLARPAGLVIDPPPLVPPAMRADWVDATRA